MCIYVHFFQLGVLPVISLVDGSVQLPGLTVSEFSTKRSPAHLSLSGGEEDSPVTAFILGEMLVQPSKGLSLAHPDHLPFPLNPYSFFLCEKYLLSFNRRENNHVRWVVFPFSIPMRCLGALLARWDYFFFLFPPFFPPSPAPWAQFHVTAPSEDWLLQEVAGTFLPLPRCGNPALEQPQGSDSS